MGQTSRQSLERHGITERRGFLPNEDPLPRFDVDRHSAERASYLSTFDRLGERLPELLEAGASRPEIEALDPPLDGLLDALSRREIVRLCLLSGFLASGYVNEIGSETVDRLPEGVAVPLYRTSQRLGREPILAYDHISLQNFRRPNPEEPIELDNLDTLQQFTPLGDERWFTLVHVAIEAAAGPGLVAAGEGHVAIRRDDPERLRTSLETITESLEHQTEIMSRMTERNDPEVFAAEFRPYYEGFDDLVFEGVADLGGEPQTLRGGSGAQSCVLPSLDAALGIDHESTILLEKLLDIRTYIPEPHRAVVAAFESDVDVRPYVREQSDSELTAAFNRCVDELQRFRSVHFGQVMEYIRAQTDDPTGTGGTDYMSFLDQMEAETSDHKV